VSTGTDRRGVDRTDAPAPSGAGGAIPDGAGPGGAGPGGADPGGASPGGADPGGAIPGGADPGGAIPGGAIPGGASPGGAGPRPGGGAIPDGGGAARVRLARIALGYLAEPGSRALGELVGRVGPVEAVRRLHHREVRGTLGEVAARRLLAADPYDVAERALHVADRLGARIAVPEDPEWPTQLEDLKRLRSNRPGPVHQNTFPPHCLWLRGPWSLAQACERSVAVVGSRASTSYGEYVAGELGSGLAERDWTVVSGGAVGIDAAAHRGALAAAGCTIAVLACGIDRPYPVVHHAMFDRIAEEGLLVSEWPPGSDPHRHRFLVRNRVIAAATVGTVVVEASLRSGARFTVGRARELNRVIMAVPGPVTSGRSAGCHEEVREGQAVLVTTAAQVIDAVGRIGIDLAPVPRAEPTALDVLTPLEACVLDGVRPRKVLTAEEIAVAVGVSARDARRALPGLETLGFITAQGSGYRLRRKSDDAHR
jgi:DNA processing protein